MCKKKQLLPQILTETGISNQYLEDNNQLKTRGVAWNFTLPQKNIDRNVTILPLQVNMLTGFYVKSAKERLKFDFQRLLTSTDLLKSEIERNVSIFKSKKVARQIANGFIENIQNIEVFQVPEWHATISVLILSVFRP